MIVDCHTHIFAPDVIRDRERLSRSEPWFRLLYGSGAKMATADDLLRSMDGAGIDRSVVMSFGWQSDEACAANNEYLMETTLKADHRIIPFIAVNPSSEEVAMAEIERWAAAGARGVGELYADGQRFDLGDSQSISAVADACARSGLFLCVHITEPVGHDYAGKDSTDTGRLWKFLSSAPSNLKVLLSHWGGGFGFYELMPEVAERSGEWYYDTAASHLLYDNRVYSIMNRLAPNRVVFGSDFPLTGQARMLNRIGGAGLSESEFQALVGDNAVRAGLG